jgi:hypothetical protein
VGETVPERDGRGRSRGRRRDGFGPDAAGAKAVAAPSYSPRRTAPAGRKARHRARFRAGKGRGRRSEAPPIEVATPRGAAPKCRHEQAAQCRATDPRISGRRELDDYDIFDGHRDVGRIYFIETYRGRGNWFWGLSFQATGRKSLGHTASLDEAKAAFAAEYHRRGSADIASLRPLMIAPLRPGRAPSAAVN